MSDGWVAWNIAIFFILFVFIIGTMAAAAMSDLLKVSPYYTIVGCVPAIFVGYHIVSSGNFL